MAGNQQKYEVCRHYRDDIVHEKVFSDLNEALTCCIEDDTLCRDDGHALSIRKNYCDSIFEINYYGNLEIDVDKVATEDELKIIEKFIKNNF